MVGNNTEIKKSTTNSKLSATSKWSGWGDTLPMYNVPTKCQQSAKSGGGVSIGLSIQKSIVGHIKKYPLPEAIFFFYSLPE